MKINDDWLDYATNVLALVGIMIGMIVLALVGGVLIGRLIETVYGWLV